MGGIQSYLWELWRRLPPEQVVVLTTPYAGDREFDRDQPFRVERAREPVLLPLPGVVERVRGLADRAGAGLVVLDPALPLGLAGPRLGRPYAVVVHGAEVSVPGRLPGAAAALRRVLGGAALVLAAGRFVADEVRRLAPSATVEVIPPGVDPLRFRPLDAPARAAVRAAHGLPDAGRLVVAVTRLVPRKGIDVLIAAAALLAPTHPDLTVAVAGSGRDRDRLARLIATSGAPVRLVGRLPDGDLPPFLAAGDVFAMPCRPRWAGLEQEGFGIVFLEAAACGVAQVAGRTGGAAEAVAHGQTGLVVDRPADPEAVAGALRRLLGDEALRARMGEAGRRRAEKEFSYDVLARRLGAALEPLG